MQRPRLVRRTRDRLKVHLYSICWNEAHMLGFFFRHYDPWVTRYVFYDDGSTDGTLDILRRHPRVEVRRFDRVVPDSFVMSARRIHNEAWKESRGAADWVVLTPVDEHLHHPRLLHYLRTCHAAGITLIPALGYQMVADEFPPAGSRLCTRLRRGAPHEAMNKLSLFRPDAIAETNFSVGRHAANPTGDVRLPDRDELLLLHYKFLGVRYTRERHAMLATGLGAIDRINGWGREYFYDEQGINAIIASFAAYAVDIGDPNLQPWKTHQTNRWWSPRGDRANYRLLEPAGPGKPL